MSAAHPAQLEDLDPDIIRALARHLKLAPEVAETLVLDAARASSAMAREAINDPSAPPQLRALAMLAATASGQPVVAIRRTVRTQYHPARPVRAILVWHSDRCFNPASLDPPAVESSSVWWSFVTTGNPVMLEGLLRTWGYGSAFAAGPNYCYVEACAPDPE